MGEVTIGYLMPEDLSEFVEFYPAAFGGWCDLKITKERYEAISNLGYKLVTARIDGILCGYLMAVIIQDLVEDGAPFMTLWSVCTHPNYRRRGVGAAMMHHIEELAKKENCEFIAFISGVHRKGAHAFYEQLGYDLNRERGAIKYLCGDDNAI